MMAWLGGGGRVLSNTLGIHRRRRSDPNHCVKGRNMWVTRAGPGMSRGGESGVHVSSVVGPPLDRAFDLSPIVGEVRRGSLETEESEVCQPDNPRPP